MKSYIVRRTILALAFTVGTCVESFSQSSSSATIVFRIVDSDGNPLDYRVASLSATESPAIELVGKVKNLVFEGATLGMTYRCLVAPSKPKTGFPTHVVELTATNFRTVAVISVNVKGTIDSIGPLIRRFVVRPSPVINDELTWVVVRPAFSTANEPVESTTIGRDGGFTLEGPHGGLFLITIHRGNRLLATRIITIPWVSAGEVVEIKLD